MRRAQEPTYERAAKWCAAVGARLCSEEEFDAEVVPPGLSPQCARTHTSHTPAAATHHRHRETTHGARTHARTHARTL